MMEAREGTQSRNWRQGPWKNNTYWLSRAHVQSVSLHSPERDAAYSALDPSTTKIMKTDMSKDEPDRDNSSTEGLPANSTLLTINTNWTTR